MTAMLRRLLRLFAFDHPRRWWLLAATFLMLAVAAADLTQAASDATAGRLAVSMLTGAGAAWALGQAKGSATRAWALYASAGVGAITLLTARVWGALSGLFNETFSLLFAWLGREPLAVGALAANLLDLNARLVGLLARLWQWLAAQTQGRTLEDPLVAGWLWLVAGWLLAGWVGWRLARSSDVPGAFVPLLAAQALVLSADRATQTTFLWVNVLIFVSLLGLVHLERRMRAWHANKLDYAEGALTGSLAGVLALATLLVGLAGLTPSISVEEIQQAWNEYRATWEDEARPDGSQPGGDNSSRTSGGRIVAGLPRNHLLGADISLSETPVMRVRTNDFSPMPRADVQLDVPRYYWRAYTYDFYSGQGWASSPVESDSYPAGEIFSLEQPEFYRQVTHEFELFNPQEQIVFRAGELIGLNVPLRAEWRNSLARLSLPGAPNSNADLFRAIPSANSYRASSQVANVDVETLRAVLPEYPDWVRTRYLALPPLPERVTVLALEITASAPSVYDRAEAIERYLRQNYAYTLDVSEPPPGRDPVDYFLFELGEGYCDYYASAMVVLARASGIPARLVVGYVGGTYDPVQAAYTVREANAHSWVEVYFPQIGWVEFEPTASQPGFQRASTGAARLPVTPQETPDPSASPMRGWLTRLEQTLPWAGLVILLALLGLGIYRFARDLRNPHLRAARRIERVYLSMRRREARRLGAPLPASLTAQELLESMKRFYETRQEQKHKANLLADAEVVVTLYEKTIFSDRAPDNQDARLAEKAWRRLRWRL